MIAALVVEGIVFGLVVLVGIGTILRLLDRIDLLERRSAVLERMIDGQAKYIVVVDRAIGFLEKRIDRSVR